MFFTNNTDVESAFGVKLISSSQMNTAIKRWDDISTGFPPWLNEVDDIETVNMAKLIADTRAKLIMLDIGIAVSGSARADFLQALADDLIAKMPDKLADAERLGGAIIKWNGRSWDFVLQGDFGVTHVEDSDEITGVIFASYAVQGDDRYTRLEYHRFEGEDERGRIYTITNKAFRNQVSQNGRQYVLGSEVPLDTVSAWAHFTPEVRISNLEHPLFGYYRVPGSNIIDSTSPLGLSVFANAETELKAIDVAISRKNTEIEDSKHITFVGQTLVRSAQNTGVELPRFVKGLGMGLNDNDVSAIHEHAPTIQTADRIADINFDLSLAGVKCGFSEGVFVMDGQTGMITATQVESDDRDTIQTIKTDRDALKTALERAIYGADALASLYDLAPLGTYELDFNFGDITYSYEEDKAAWRTYAMQGWIPKWQYFVKFEGMSEEEAKALTAEAQAENMAAALFSQG